MKNEFEITVVNTETGESETVGINKESCWAKLKSAFFCGYETRAKKPVKMHLNLIPVKK